MTPPLTDAELLAYIERTPELAALFPDAARWLSPHAAPYANVARAFHAHEQRVREEERALNDSTAPQLSTAAVSTAPSPEGAGQGEAAEAVGLLRAVKKDLEDRAEDGVVELSSNVWQQLCDFLTKQGGK